jgi:RimJ/RimL family protein N-acetyltransferase
LTSSVKTDRLELLAWAPAHDELLVAWSSDPAVVRYIGDGSVWSRDRALEVAAHQRDHWDEHGFGWRIAVAGGSPVGFIALSFAGEGAGVAADEYEIGWWLVPSAWGHGYAREGAAALRDEAWRVGAPSIVARIQPVNSASVAVAEAIGLTYERASIGRGGETISVYRGGPAQTAP